MKKMPEIDLYDFIESKSSIACKECGLKDEVSEDVIDSITYFYDNGWRIVKHNPLCKNCSNLKKQ